MAIDLFDILNAKRDVGLEPDWLRAILEPEFPGSRILDATSKRDGSPIDKLAPNIVNFASSEVPSSYSRFMEMGRPEPYIMPTESRALGRASEITKGKGESLEKVRTDIARLESELSEEFPSYKGTQPSALELLLSGLAFATAEPENAAAAVAGYFITKEQRARQEYEDKLKNLEAKRKIQLAKYGRLSNVEHETMSQVGAAERAETEIIATKEAQQLAASMANNQAINEWKKLGMTMAYDDFVKSKAALEQKIADAENNLMQSIDPEMQSKHAALLQQLNNQYFTLLNPTATPEEKYNMFVAKYPSLASIAGAPSPQSQLAYSEIERSKARERLDWEKFALEKDLHPLQKQLIETSINSSLADIDKKRAELKFFLDTYDLQKRAMVLDNMLKEAQIKAARAAAAYAASGGKTSGSVDAIASLKSVFSAVEQTRLLIGQANEDLQFLYKSVSPRQDPVEGKRIIDKFNSDYSYIRRGQKAPSGTAWTDWQLKTFPSVASRVNTLRNAIRNAEQALYGDRLSGTIGMSDVATGLFGTMFGTRQASPFSNKWSAPTVHEIPGGAGAYYIK